MKNNNKDNKIILTVAEAYYDDVGRGIVRLPDHIMEELNLHSGDIIKIESSEGKGKTVATVWRARYEDEGQDIIRMDGMLRSNAETSLGEKVTISKADCSEAQTVVLNPVEEIRFNGDPTPYFHGKLLNRPLLKSQKIIIDLMGTQLHYVVTKITPGECGLITENTNVIVSDKVVKPESLKLPEVTYEDIGGLKKEIELIREMVELPMKHPQVFEKLGVGAPKGVLLTGPPGTGKTLLAKAVANETDSQFYIINGPEIMSKYYGESEKHLREIFEEAEKNTPSIIFIDEIDSIAPKRGEGKDQTEKRIVAQLLTLMDGLKGRGRVVVMAATNRPDDIDEALRRPGRFDRELRIMPPDEEGRREILQIHTRGMPLDKNVDLEELARRTIGFTGADLEALAKEAALKALREYIPEITKQKEVPTEVLEKIKVKQKHFIDALKMIEPTAMRELVFTKPKVTWNDIGGLEETKRALQETIELPLKKPELFEKAGIKPPKGILLYGPPGTGKTLLAKAIANEANANFISVKGPELISKWVGESEKKIRELFKKARMVAPTIIFFDEFDSISKVRGSSLTDSTERMINQLLTEIDGMEELEKVTIVAATNRPDLIDPALLRPGRIELKLEVPLPDEKARLKILEVHTKNMPLDKNVDLKSYAKKSEGWSGADLEALTRMAGMNSIRRAFDSKKEDVKITKDDFEKAFKELKEKIKLDKKKLDVKPLTD